MHTFRRVDPAQVVRKVAPKEYRGSSLRLPLELTAASLPTILPQTPCPECSWWASFLPWNTKATHPALTGPVPRIPSLQISTLPPITTPSPPPKRLCVHLLCGCQGSKHPCLECQDPWLRQRALRSEPEGTCLALAARGGLRTYT